MEDYFDWVYYVNKYKDLQNANINTYDKALKHWRMFGIKEGRICNKNTIKPKTIIKKKIIKKPVVKEIKQEEIINYGNLLDYINKEDLNNYYIDAEKSQNILNEPKIIAVIPVHGREALLKYTIRRLYNKNKLYKVICVGSTETEKKVVLEENGIWVEHENKPLGKKWNTGFKIAQIYKPDAILFVGSSDWISTDWIDNAYKYLLNDNIGIVGKNRFDMIDVNNINIRSCYWLGYPEDNERFKETIGIGRLISRKLLDKINFEPFDNQLDNSMDYSMYQKCIKNDFKIKIIDSFGFFLSISCNKWFNKHTFNYHYLASNNKIEELLKLGLNDEYINIYMRSRNHTLSELKYIYKEFNELNNFYFDINSLNN